ncbi:Lcl C-terminal domain-containing protein [Caenispirillum salinarum]|nr:DUF1566 domain-containing protein [Caenispirillum salinarum]
MQETYVRRALAALAVALLCASGGAFAQGPGSARNGPPPQAVSACSGLASGAACGFQAPRGHVSGTCHAGHGRPLACRPAGQRGVSPGAGAQGGAMPPKRGYTPAAAPFAEAVALSNRLTDTGQHTCFTDTAATDCTRAAAAGFPGQDGWYASRTQTFEDRGDGTVFDPATGLLWQQGHNARRLSFGDATAACAALRLGGRADWRLPSIRELYSITHWQGVTGQRPFVAPAFAIAAPDATVLEGDRFAATHAPEMMGQTWSATVYAGDHYGRPGIKGVFFFNFLDGRIKQAPRDGRNGLFWRCVAGPAWGVNAFTDRGDGSVHDGLTGLTWQQVDDGRPRTWGEALRHCDGLTHGGFDDWRLPNVKELQSIVDYSRPAPAVDPVFRQADPRAWFWSSTTFGDDPAEALYVCFGPCTSAEGVDVHGAGAQRSDPKAGARPGQGGRGGQNDEMRGRNHVRCVRG